MVSSKLTGLYCSLSRLMQCRGDIWACGMIWPWSQDPANHSIHFTSGLCVHWCYTWTTWEGQNPPFEWNTMQTESPWEREQRRVLKHNAPRLEGSFTTVHSAGWRSRLLKAARLQMKGLCPDSHFQNKELPVQTLITPPGFMPSSLPSLQATLS